MDKDQIYDTLNRAYFSDDCHEKNVVTHLPILLRDRSVVVDVGASLGQYTRAASRSIVDGEIWALEADPIRAEQLERNCSEWAAESDNNTIKAMHLALTSHTGEVPYFVTNSDVSGGLSRHETPREVDWEQITIQSSTLDDLFPDRAPDFVKIDVEGAELPVLEGARRILAEGRTEFLVEIHDWDSRPRNRDEVLQLMQAAGYVTMSFFGMPLFLRSRRRLMGLKCHELWLRARARLG